MARTITAANSIIMLSVEGLFNTPRQLQGFTADNIFGMDSITTNETSMGVDGHLSGGFVHSAKVMNIMLKADSMSNDLFERWHGAEQQIRESYIATGLVTIPATNRKYTLTRGFLTSYSPPSAGRTLSDRQYTLTWGKIEASSMI